MKTTIHNYTENMHQYNLSDEELKELIDNIISTCDVDICGAEKVHELRYTEYGMLFKEKEDKVVPYRFFEITVHAQYENIEKGGEVERNLIFLGIRFEKEFKKRSEYPISQKSWWIDQIENGV